MSNFWGAVQPFRVSDGPYRCLTVRTCRSASGTCLVGAGEGVAADIAAQRQHGGGAEGVVYVRSVRTGYAGSALRFICRRRSLGGEAGFAAAHALCNFRIAVPCQLAGQGQAAFFMPPPMSPSASPRRRQTKEQARVFAIRRFGIIGGAARSTSLVFSGRA